jgi:hypothetical protein
MMNAVLDNTFARMIDRLCALDDATNGYPGVGEAERPRALAGLEHLLLDREALDEYIRYLQKRFGRTFRHQALLAGERAERIVSHGASVLPNDQLAALLLNPIALRDLAFRIGEEQGRSHGKMMGSPKEETAVTLTIEIDLPADLARFRLPEAVAARLHDLLDRQDSGQTLTPKEREEAEGLVNLAEFLTLLRLRAERTSP